MSFFELHRSEVSLMMRTLRDMNMSKFVAEDVPLFLQLIEDLFPNQQANRSEFPEVVGALRKVSNFASAREELFRTKSSK
jgi:dynein heavy chain, axonemal